ncbi:hypothetical protein POM88_040320 [Heracleum sosnowskyi]|uniref:DNA-directed RNA polymerase subunit n=1 Tax=Heracleum sosnowskyi TaxID=360622 RepID=A0AAD8M9P4_9APIA|nr:hypothetical protein POM88_040320 [Heracleum sosnowskyi]
MRKVAYVLSTPKPIMHAPPSSTESSEIVAPANPELAKEIDLWVENDFLCNNFILNGLSDNLHAWTLMHGLVGYTLKGCAWFDVRDRVQDFESLLIYSGSYSLRKELKRIGTGTVLDSLDYVLFPVSVQCRTFLPVNGEIMHGVVYKVNVIGVFMRREPMRFIFLPAQKMPGYSYVHDDQNPCFVSTDGSRIGLDVIVSFRVSGARWFL